MGLSVRTDDDPGELPLSVIRPEKQQKDARVAMGGTISGQTKAEDAANGQSAINPIQLSLAASSDRRMRENAEQQAKATMHPEIRDTIRGRMR